MDLATFIALYRTNEALNIPAYLAACDDQLRTLTGRPNATTSDYPLFDFIDCGIDFTPPAVAALACCAG